MAQRWWPWLAVLAAVLIAWFAWSRHLASERAAANANKRPLVPVIAVQARRGDLNVYLSALGSVAAFNNVVVRARVDGELVKVGFTEGQYVNKGDFLAQIDPRPYQAQLEQMHGQLAKDRAELKVAELTLARDRSLFAQHVIAKQDLDNQVATAGQYRGAIQSDIAAVNNARLQLDYCHIIAPLSGRIGLRLVDPGNMVHATDTQGLAVIAQLQPIAVLFSIPEDSIEQVIDAPKALAAMDHTPGDTAGQALPVEAYDRNFQRRLGDGTLLTIDNQIDQSTGTVRLKAVFPNQDGRLFPNQFVNVKLLVGIDRNSILLPTAAVQRSPQGTFVYVVGSAGAVEARKVSISTTQGVASSLKLGVNPGEVVVVEGMDKLRQGTRVKVQLTSNTAAAGSQ